MSTENRERKKSERTYLRKVEKRKLLRKEEKCRKRGRIRQMIRKQIDDGTYCSKRFQKQLISARLQKSFEKGLVVCIDCTYENEMSKKECSKFAQQFRRAYGANRASENPVSLHLVNFNPCGQLASACEAQCDGFDSYMIGKHEQSAHVVFPNHRQIVYLSPDAEQPLLELDQERVYVIGCLVDEHVMKNKSLEEAEKQQCMALRLPFQEFFPKDGKARKSPVLALNHVVELLLVYRRSNCNWLEAFQSTVPPRFLARL